MIFLLFLEKIKNKKHLKHNNSHILSYRNNSSNQNSAIEKLRRSQQNKFLKII